MKFPDRELKKESDPYKQVFGGLTLLAVIIVFLLTMISFVDNSQEVQTGFGAIPNAANLPYTEDNL